jgi:hypothetical protein
MRSIIVSIFLVAGSLMVVQAAANFLQTWQARRYVDYQASLPPSPDNQPALYSVVGKAAADTRSLQRPARPEPKQTGQSQAGQSRELAGERLTAK